MKRYWAIAIIVYFAFALEFVAYNLFGSWGKPELIVLLVVFFNLYWGIRHSLWAAFIGGALKGAFDIEPTGTYVLVLIGAAYLTTFLRKSIYHPGSRFSRLITSFLVLTVVFLAEMVLHMRHMPVRWLEALQYVFFPSMALTMLVATLIFSMLKDLVVRLKL